MQKDLLHAQCLETDRMLFDKSERRPRHWRRLTASLHEARVFQGVLSLSSCLPTLNDLHNFTASLAAIWRPRRAGDGKSELERCIR